MSVTPSSGFLPSRSKLKLCICIQIFVFERLNGFPEILQRQERKHFCIVPAIKFLHDPVLKIYCESFI